MSGPFADNFSDSASNVELLEKAKREFNREKRIVIKNLPSNTTEKEIRAFMGFNGEFPVEDVSMVKNFNQAIVTLKDSTLVQDAVAKLNNTKLGDLTVVVAVYHSDKLLCVAHLPLDMTEYKFRELVTEHGTLEKCFLMRSEATGESKGYGFVEYMEPIEKVGQIKCGLDWKETGGHVLHCDAITDSSQSGGITFNDLHSKCLLINNLPPDYKDSIALREVFSSLVKPVYCQIVTKEGESLGFGIIEYDSGEDAERAFQKFYKYEISGVAINISYCIPGKSAVHMFNRIMFKYGDKVHVNRASLLPDPVYPNPVFLKHTMFKTHVSKHPRLLVNFTESLLHLQEGYVRQLEDKTNAKPGLLGPPPTIPMSPLMDVNLQLGLLTLLVLDMREKGTYPGEIPDPLGKLKIPTEEEFQQKPEPVSLLGDPMTAQANIILKNLLMPTAEKGEFSQVMTEDKDEPKLLGRSIRQLNLVYLCSLGRLMAMMTDRTQSMGILGTGPGTSASAGPKPIIESLVQAGKMAQSLLNSMGINQQSNPNQRMNQGGPNFADNINQRGNQSQISPKNNTVQAANNFMNTIQALAMQKFTASQEGSSQILNQLFGNTMGDKSTPGAGLLGNYPGPGQSGPRFPPGGGGGGGGGRPQPGMNKNFDRQGDGLLPLPTPPMKDEDSFGGYHGNQGGGNNYDDSGYQGSYESDYNDGYNDNYGGGGYNSGGYSGYSGFDSPPGGGGDTPNRRMMGKKGFGGNRMMPNDMSNSGAATEKYDGAYFSGINDTRHQRRPPSLMEENEYGEKKDYDRIAQQAAAYAAGAAAAYKRQFEEYMAQNRYSGGYNGGYNDDNSGSGNYNGGYGSESGYETAGYGTDNTVQDSYSTAGGYSSYNSSKSSYGGYDEYSSSYSKAYRGPNSTVGRGGGGNSMSRSGPVWGSSFAEASSSNFSSAPGGPIGNSGGYGGGPGSRFSGYDSSGAGPSSDSNQGPYGRGSMRPPLPPPLVGGSSNVMGTPQGQKRPSSHLLPSPEPSPEGDYIGQHSQGIGGHYADSYSKRQRLTGMFSY